MQEIEAVQKDALLNRASDLKDEGWRLIQICCSAADEGYELDYSFDKDYNLIDLKVQACSGEEIPSISVIFPPAFLYENEMEALYGVKVLHKSVDFGGKLYMTAQKTPFAQSSGEGKDK